MKASDIEKNSLAYEALRTAQLVAEHNSDETITVILGKIPWRRWTFKRQIVAGIQRLLLVGYED